jgi:predicted ATPase/DNA-binding winged helix-turn-helix (wHTH) protein
MLQSGSKVLRFRVGDKVVEIYRDRRLVLVDGSEVDLGGRGFDCLLLLTLNPDRVVKKQEFIDGAWGGTTIADSTYRTQFSIIRSAIGSSSIRNSNGIGYQLTVPVEAVDAPSVPAIETAPSLARPPLPTSRLVGRDDDLAGLLETCSGARRVTVIGTGGVGKTTLVLYAVPLLRERFGDQIVWIDLAPANSASAVGAAAARALGIGFGARTQLVSMIAGHIGERRVALIFDTCEHVADAVGELVMQLTDLCPNLLAIATSQAVLHVPGEAFWRVLPLLVDHAANLFIARLRDHHAGYEPAASDLETVRTICQRVDCLPLVIEMLAPRARVIGVDHVLSGLPRRFEMLGALPGARGADRQRSLAAVLRWSVDTLEPQEAVAFRRLGAFGGSFSATAAIHLLTGFEDGQSPWEAQTILAQLIDKSMIRLEPGTDPRYRMLENVRMFAQYQLDTAGEFDIATLSIVDFYSRLFDQAWMEAEQQPENTWLAKYAPELDNLRAGRDWLLSKPEHTDMAARYLAVTGPLWLRMGLAAELRPAFEHVLKVLPSDPAAATAGIFFRTAGMLWRRVNRLEALSFSQRAETAFRRQGQNDALADVLASIGGDLVYLGRKDEAKRRLEEALSLAAAWQKKAKSRVVNELGTFALQSGDLSTANQHFTSLHAIAADIGSLTLEGIALGNLAELEFRHGALLHAIELASQGAEKFHADKQPLYEGASLINMAGYNAILPNISQTKRLLASALPLIGESSYLLRIFLQICAYVLASTDLYNETAQLQGFIDAEEDRAGEDRQLLRVLLRENVDTILAINMDQSQRGAAARQGTRWKLDMAVDFGRRRCML